MAPVPERGTIDSASRLRVVVLTHLFPSPESPGRGSFVKEQCRSLSEHCKVTVVTGRWGQAERTEEVHEAVRVIAVPLRAPACLPSPVRVLSAIPGYARAALAEIDRLDTRTDIIHAHFALPDGITAMRTGRAAGLPVVMTLHGSDYNRQMSRPVVGRVLVKAIAEADAIIAVSRQIAEGLKSRVPSAADRVEFVPNGYDSGLIRYEPKTDGGDFLFIGALKPVKNPLLLLEAYSRIASETSRGLKIIGEGPLRAEIERAVSERGLSDRVRLLGRVPHDRLQPHLREAGALVLPSVSEGMPLVVIESLATGTPVVASSVGAIPDLVEPGRSGLLVAPGDGDGLANALLQAQRMQWDYASIAKNAPIIDWAENARQVTALYRRVLQRRLGRL